MTELMSLHWEQQQESYAMMVVPQEPAENANAFGYRQDEEAFDLGEEHQADQDGQAAQDLLQSQEDDVKKSILSSLNTVVMQQQMLIEDLENKLAMSRQELVQLQAVANAKQLQGHLGTSSPTLKQKSQAQMKEQSPKKRKKNIHNSNNNALASLSSSQYSTDETKSGHDHGMAQAPASIMSAFSPIDTNTNYNFTQKPAKPSKRKQRFAMDQADLIDFNNNTTTTSLDVVINTMDEIHLAPSLSYSLDMLEYLDPNSNASFASSVSELSVEEAEAMNMEARGDEWIKEFGLAMPLSMQYSMNMEFGFPTQVPVLGLEDDVLDPWI
mmetsp:Transcript_19943/g.34287  ORF Transcript_19943/g.34287 Transcript_19943/m.34287 type:complete len:326 (+) Transcript_19943:832-1809(+)